MKESCHEFSALQNCRYTITAVCNVTPQGSIYGFGSTGSPWELALNITYKELATKLRTYFNPMDDSRCEAPSSSSQSYRNHLSTLNSFLSYEGKTLDSRVGVEFGSRYDQKLGEYLSQITVAKRTKRDRRSHLNLLRRLFDETKAADSVLSNKETGLNIELRRALAAQGVAPTVLAKQIGVSPSALQRWLKGAIPNQRAIPSIRRIEKALGLPRDALVSLMPAEVGSKTGQPWEIVYRAQLRDRVKDSYGLSEAEMSLSLQSEWSHWFEAKTSHTSSRTYKGERRWRVLPPGANTRCSKFAMLGESSCPTADWALGHVRRYIGWMKRPTEQYGGGFAPEDVQTLAWFCQPTVVESFLQFLTERSDGVKHSGQAGFARLVNQLTRPERGFLWWHPDFRHRLPSNVRPASEDEWRNLCSKTSAIADAWIQDSSDKNRRPSEPIANLLEVSEPLLPLLNAVREIEQLAAKALPGGVTEARHRRNALLLAFLVSNPLRSRTLSTLTWLPNNRGNVYRSSNGKWRLRLSSVLMKNGASELKRRPYDVELSSWVGEMLDTYIEEFRPVLLKGVKNRFLFVAASSERPWSYLDCCVFELTKRFIPGSPGFGPHSIRHLVATDWLTKHPNDFLTVAELLNDRLETVMANYAHLKRDVSLGRLGAHIDELRTRHADL